MRLYLCRVVPRLAQAWGPRPYRCPLVLTPVDERILTPVDERILTSAAVPPWLHRDS